MMGERDDAKINYVNTIAFILVMMIFFLLLRNKGHESEKHEKTFKGETIGLATRFKYGRKLKYLQYYFYLNKRIVSKVSIDNNTDSKVLDKFYKVKYDLDNPEEGNYIILEEELKPDSITLVKAGFTKTKYYIYDAGVTCKYIEKSKWK